MRAWLFVSMSWLFGLTHSVESQDRRVSRIAVERSSDVCSALDPAQCCAQMMEIAIFRATGDQLPKAVKAPVRLSCQDSTHTIPENACRLIAMGRGFGAREAAQLCVPEGLSKRCADDATCKQCVSDLDRLDWKAPARACYALTYVSSVASGRYGSR